jgi:hypothetical protein
MYVAAAIKKIVRSEISSAGYSDIVATTLSVLKRLVQHRLLETFGYGEKILQLSRSNLGPIYRRRPPQGSTLPGVAGCAWGAEVAGFCRSVPVCAGWKSFKCNEINTWLKTGSQEVASSILASSTNNSFKILYLQSTVKILS